MDNKECISKYKVLQEYAFLNMPCPRCGRHSMRAKNVENSLSRYAEISICPQCGTEEAMDDFYNVERSLDDWYAVRLMNGNESFFQRNEKPTPHYEMRVTTVVAVTDEDIDDILCNAFEGGITADWCRRVDVSGEMLGEYASEQISRGGNLILVEDEDESRHELTLDKFMKGLRMFLSENEGNGVSYLDNGRIDTGTLDGIASDAVVQYALFGEVVYG